MNVYTYAHMHANTHTISLFAGYLYISINKAKDFC